MTKKKVDQRIRTLIENGVHQRHRSLLVIIGDKGKEQVANLHYILSRSQVAKRPTILWCYKKELGFSSHMKKRMKESRKLQRMGLKDGNAAAGEEDPFDLFLNTTDIRYTFYHETDKILGQTFGMAVLQDFEALTPNLLARTIETVQGGGLVVLLLRTLTSLKQLATMAMDVHARYRTSASEHEPVARFNERFLLSLTTCKACLVMDDELNVLPVSSHSLQIEPVPANASVSENPQLQALKDQVTQEASQPNAPASVRQRAALVKLAKTLDQANVLQGFITVLSDQRASLRTTCSLTAGRGRGKSAALGLALAASIAQGPENLGTLFEFLFKGLDALGYTEHADYDCIQSTHAEFNKAVVRVNVFKGDHRQTILYVQPRDHHLLAQADLVLIDEAAAIPLPLVQAMIGGSHLVMMASTINGYEGTGRSLSLKLLQQLRSQTMPSGQGTARHLKEWSLDEPIRYAPADPVEQWLNQLLCLDATSVPLKTSKSLPAPSACELYEVNRDTLFSYHRASESFLQRLMALCVASHYKNTPNDLQLLSDAPAHRLFVLLGPVDSNATGLPDILACLQVAYEGAISKQVIMSSLARGQRAAGDLIPWTIAQQFQDDDFAALSGARVVRLAVHPDMQRMGYGSRAMELLEAYFKGSLWSGVTEEMEEVPAAVIEDGQQLKPRANLKPLLVKLADRPPESLHWLGVSFGLTAPLYRFWCRLGLLPVYLRQTANEITGEHSAIMLKGLDKDARGVACQDGWLTAFHEDYRRRFASLAAYQFRTFAPSLCLEMLAPSANSTEVTVEEQVLSAHDLKRLEAYSDNLLDYHAIVDLLPAISRHVFVGGGQGKVSLSPLQSAILVACGLQHRTIDDLVDDLKLPASQLLAMFIKVIRKLVQHFRSSAISAIEEREGKIESPEENEEAQPVVKINFDAVADLNQDLDESGKQALEKLRKKQRELINSLPLDEYRIGGDDAEWERELGKKRKNLDQSIVNVKGNANKKGSGVAKELAQNIAAKKAQKSSKKK